MLLIVFCSCLRCKKAWYCCYLHQRFDWKQHRLSCHSKFNTETAPIRKECLKYHVINPFTKTKHQMIKSLKLNGKKNFFINEYNIWSQKLQTLSKYAIENLHNNGYCVIDNFLGEMKADKVLFDFLKILQSETMHDGKTSGYVKEYSRTIRGDKIAWITGEEKQYPNTKFIINDIDRLMAYMRSGLQEYAINGRTPVSWFPRFDFQSSL